MFESRKELTEKLKTTEDQLAGAEADAKELSAELDTLKEAHATLTQDLDAEKKAHDAAAAELATNKEELAAAVKDNAEQTKKLETFDTEVETKAKAISAQHLEKLGHPALAIVPSADDPSAEPVPDILQKAESIEDPSESYTFHKENAAAIKAAIAAKFKPQPA